MSPLAGRKQSVTEIKGGVKQEQRPDHNEKEAEKHLEAVATGAESDVDELVDSDTERVSEATAKATKATSKTKTKGAATSKKASVAPTKKPATGQKPRAEEQQPASAMSNDAAAGGSKGGGGGNGIKEGELASNERQTSPSLRESLGRTATGGPVPYYYPQAQNGRSASSPSAKHGSKKPLPRDTIDGSMRRSAKEEEAHGGSRDLTGEEVDKFLALIEKYDLDTTNEDDMARSVTEVYQEWLEWCAKRNVKSSKSKQALVLEFPKLYSGYYGKEYQDRAMGIVQRQQSARAALANGGGGSHDAGFARDRPPYAGGEVGTSDRAPRPVHGASSSTMRSSPNGVQRQAPRGDADHLRVGEIPPAILESMHMQIRDEIWREASTMISQVVHERFVDMAAENHALMNRIEQLELHSDNLAQWVQHLNRVQEDLHHSMGPHAPLPSHMAAQRPPFPPPEDGPGADNGRPRQAYMHNGPPAAGPSFHPGHGPPYAGSDASPQHRYHGPPRRSMSPPRGHYAAGPTVPPGPPMHGGGPYHDGYDRHDGPPPPQSSHGMLPHQQHPAYHTSPRGVPSHVAGPMPGERLVGYHDEPIPRGGPPPPPAAYAAGYADRGPYPPSRDDRPMARRPDSPAGPGVDGRHAKRARNAGGVY